MKLKNEKLNKETRDIQLPEYVFDEIFSQAERLVFAEYFFGAKLKEIYASIKIIKERGLPKPLSEYRELLAAACFKFIMYVDICPDSTPEALNQILAEIKLLRVFKIKTAKKYHLLYKEIYSINTLRKDLFKAVKSRKQGAKYFRQIQKYLLDFYVDCQNHPLMT